MISGNARTNTWFNTKNIGVKVVTMWMKNMMGLINMSGYVTNKSPRYTTIQHMIEAGIPTQVGMAITGHKFEVSYRRYDQSIELEKMAAMQIVEPFRNGKRRMFTDIYTKLSEDSVVRELVGHSTRILCIPDQKSLMDVREVDQLTIFEVEAAIHEVKAVVHEVKAVVHEVEWTSLELESAVTETSVFFITVNTSHSTVDGRKDPIQDVDMDHVAIEATNKSGSPGRRDLKILQH